MTRKILYALAPAGWVSLGLLLGWLIWSTSPQVDPHAGHDHEGQRAPTIWTCSMDPQVRATEPGKCPICGMDLVPADTLGGASAEPDEVRLDERAAKLAQIRTTVVEPLPLTGETRALLGRVEPDEARLRAATTWIGGRVEALYVTDTGARVKKGQRLAQIYSPEIYAAHQELLAALSQRTALEGGAPFAQRAAASQVEAAEQRLRLLGVTAGDLKRMRAAERPWRRISVRSAAAGTVLRRRVSQGDYVKAGAPLFELADLRLIWVQLDAYEVDLARARQGQRVQLSVEALPGRVFEGEITFIDPVLDPKTRTARLRVEVDNADGALKPGMYAQAALSSAHDDGPPPLVIPKSAPLFAGRRALVYVERGVEGGERTYKARPVKLGAPAGDHYPVLAGLSRGERVVTHGAFTLDADLQLRGGLSLMARPDDTAPHPFDEVLALERAALKRLAPVMSGYLDAQERLAESDLEGALKGAEAWRAAVEAAEVAPAAPEAVLAWGQLRAQLLADVDALRAAQSLARARAVFEHLTRDIDRLVLRFGNPTAEPVRLAYCPMAFDNEGGFWYQRAEQVDNVYYGDQMRRCGTIRASIDPGAHHMPEGHP